MRLNNKCKHIAAYLIILLLMSAFSYYTYDELLDIKVTENHFAGTKNGTAKTPALKKGDIIEQEIFFQAKKINGMGLNFCDANHGYLNGRLNVLLLEADSENVLASADIETEDINNNGYTYFQFDRQVNNKNNKKLLLRVEIKELDKNNSVLFNLSDKNVYEEETLSVNAEKSDRNIDLSIIYTPYDAVYKVVFLLLAFMTFFIAVMYYLLIMKKVKVERVFLFAVFVLGFIYMGTIIPNTVPDEQTHEYGAYYISNKMLGVEAANEEGCLYMRECDTEGIIVANNPDRKQYNYFYCNILKKADSTKIVETDRKPAYAVSKFNYIFAATGITLGRLAGFNHITVQLFGRIFNLIFYIVLCYYAIKQMPFGKAALMTVMLLPVSMQQAMSFSYDVILNPMAFALIAVCLKFAYDREHIKKHNYIMYVVLSILVMQSKGGAYIPLVLLILLPIMIAIKEMKKSEKASKKYQENKKRIKWMSIGLLLSFVGYILYRVVNIVHKNPYLTEKTDNIIEWSGTEGYTIGYFIEHPLKIISVLGRTVFEQFDHYLRTFLGGELGWFKINIPWFVIIIFLICLLLSALKVQGEPEHLTKYSRTFMLVIGFLCFAMCCGGMLLEWSPIMYGYIMGVQGRYFIPFILTILLAFRCNILTLKSNIDRYILFIMIALQPIVLFCIEHDAMCKL